MKHATQVRAYGFWGVASPPAVNFLLASENAVKVAQHGTNLMQGLRALGDGDRRVLMLAPSLKVVSNGASAWTQMAAGPSYLATNFGAFRNDAPCAAHEADDASDYRAVSWQAVTNGGHGINLFLAKPPGSYPSWWMRWDEWQFQVADGKAALQRLTPAWTRAKDNALIYLRWAAGEGISNAAANLASLEKEIYYLNENISEGGDWYGEARTIAFVPEPRGAVHIFLGDNLGGETKTIELPQAVRDLAPRLVWKDSAIDIGASGGAYFWQPNDVRFPASGYIATPSFLDNTSDDMVLSSSADSGLNNRTLAGTAITVGVYEENAVRSFLRANLTTTDHRKTPFAYALSALLQPGNRDGSTAEVWNSATCGDPGGDPILDVQAQYDGEMTARRYIITMRDVKGATLGNGLGARYPALEDRVGSLSIGGVPVVTGGIFKPVTLADMAAATENQPRNTVTLPATTVQSMLCDAWAILDEIVVNDSDIIGDGLHLGGVLRRALQLAGETDARVAGVSANAGKLIKPAAFGDGWACACSAGRLGDFLRDVVKKHGRGWRFYISGAGVWTLTPPPSPTAVGAIGGVAAHFSSDAARNHPDTFPGRLAMLNPINQLRDSSEMFNWIRVTGGEGADGLPLVYEWPVWPSIRRGLGIGARNFIGRKKVYEISDSGARTPSAVADIARSAAFYVSRPGRFHSFTTYFHREAYPGMRISCDGVLCDIRQISGAGAARDESTIDAQEI